MSARKTRSARPQFLRNLVLFFALALGVGVVAGVVGALGEDDLISGTSATTYYIPGPEADASTSPTVVEQGEDIQPGRLILYPALTLGFGTVFVLPMVLVAFGIAEIMARRGTPAMTMRVTAVVSASLLSLAIISTNPTGLFVLSGVGFMAYACVVRLPSTAIAPA